MNPPKNSGKWWRWKHIGIVFFMGPYYFVRMAPMLMRCEYTPPSNDNGRRL